MTPEEELHKIVWQILAEIKQEQLATPDDEWLIMDKRKPAMSAAATTENIGLC